MRRSRIFLLALTLMSVTSVLVAAPYIGISIGSADYTVDLSSLGGGNVEDSAIGGKLYGGYSFNKYFAAEASLYNFAEVSDDSVETSPGSGIYTRVAASMKGLGAYAVGIYPVTKEFNLMAKLGMLTWNTDLAANNNTVSESGTDAAYAIAASYAFTEWLLMTAEWESFNTDDPELTMLSLGLRVNFK